MDNLKGSLFRSIDKNNTNESFTIRIDSQTKETLKLVFIKLLNQISGVVQAEQTFCQEFFNSSVARSKHESESGGGGGGGGNASISRTGSSNSLQSTNTNASRISNESTKLEL